ncbi:MAG: aminotransferase class IV [Candidatus Omnitrophica bacterium]|nr:aminotransferase class IV [Candidatus Omnitrophota bacterium]
MKNVIFFDGNFLELEKAKVSLSEPAFLYGWSVFETMRAYRKKIVYFRMHLERIKRSSSYLSLNFSYSFKEIEKIIFKLIDLNKMKDVCVRLTLFKNLKERTSIFIWIRPYQAYSDLQYLKGFRADVSEFRVNKNSFLANLKSGNYLLYQLSYQQAKRRGFDEAVILNSDGYIAEASRSNVFFVKENKIFTPSLECGCLEGITRQVVMDIAKKHNLKVKKGSYTLDDLLKADEAFLTNSLMGIMPLVYIGKHRIGKSKFNLTHFLLKEYDYLLKYDK